MSSEQELRDSIQPMIRDELMRTWREGVSNGLTIAYRMAEAVRNEAASRVTDAVTDCARAELEAQVAALGGLMGGLETAAAEALEEPS